MLDLPPAERTKLYVGVGLWAVGCLAGALITLFFQLLAPIANGRWDIVQAMFIGAVIAVPACAVYMIVPALIDRFEPEPWWALAMAFLWGACGAAGFALLINSIMADVGRSIGGELGEHIFAASISAPLSEETFKAMAPLGVLLFMRRQFDGKVDGFIYASFAGLGFAVTENIAYYARGVLTDSLWYQFLIRGVLRPWNHAFYCALVGLGLGIARETNNSTVKILAPLGGFFLALCFHGFWNSHSLFLALIGIRAGLGTTLALTAFYLIFVLALGAIVIWFVVREGRVIRSMLHDEVLIGNLSQEDVELIVHPFGRWKARFGPGGANAKAFVLAGIRLAMTKWHATRAYQGQRYTVSMDAIAPLRQELVRLRQQVRLQGA